MTEKQTISTLAKLIVQLWANFTAALDASSDQMKGLYHTVLLGELIGENRRRIEAL